MVVGILFSVVGFSKVMQAANVECAGDKTIYQMGTNLNTLEFRLESQSMFTIYCYI